MSFLDKLGRVAKSKAIQEGLEDAERTLTHTKIPTEAMGEETQLALKRLNAEANTPNPMVQDIETAQKMRDVANKTESYKSPVSEALDRYRAGTATPEDLDILAKGMGEKQLPTAENPIIIPDEGAQKLTRTQEASTTLPQEEKGIVPYQSKALTPEVLPAEASKDIIPSQPLDINVEKAPGINIDESKLDEAIKKMNPTLWERFKDLPTSQKMAVAASMGLGAYGATKLMSGGGRSEQLPVEKAKQASQALPEKKEEVINPEDAIKEEKDAVKEQIKKLESEINAPEGSKSFVNKLIQAQGTSLGSDANLKEAQAKRDQERGYNMLGRAADIATGAVYHTGPKMEKFYDQQDEFANRHIADIKDRIANEKNDPNSSVSKAFNEILGEFGVKAQGLSGAAIEKIAPWVEKKYLAEEARKARLEQLKLKEQELKVKSEDAKKTKLEANDTKRLDTMNKLLTGEVASSRSSFGRAANTYASSEKLEALVSNRDPNSLDNREIAEVARQLDSILSNGQATISGMKKLIPEAASGDIAKLQEYLTSKRAGAGLGSFVSQMMKTVKREKELAGDQLKRTQGKLLGSYHDIYDRDPDRVKQILASQGLPIDIFDQQKEQMKSDRDAISVPKAQKSSTGKSQAIPGSTVRVRGKLYKVGADGDSLEEIK